MLHGDLLIGGQYLPAESGAAREVINPATEEIIGRVSIASDGDLEKAVQAAEAAFVQWSTLSPFERGEYLRKASRLVLQRSKEIASLMTLEQGKPLKEAEGEVKKAGRILRYYAEEGERVYGRIIPNDRVDIESRVIYQPVGVVAAITPWNYPVELVAWKVGAALAAGCPVIAKLPTQTPFSPLAFLKCLVDVGIPDGTVNALVGPGDPLGVQLVKHPSVKKVAFTGSTEVGKSVARNCAEFLKKVSLELGGSLPMIISKNCNLEEAVSGAVRRSFRNMGQICIAVNRIYVERSIYASFLEKFALATSRLTIGNGFEDDCDLGPMANKEGLEKAKLHIRDALGKGARLICGGKRPAGEKYAKGFYFEPTILADTTHDMLVMSEETFGPVVGVMPFGSLDEAISLANDTEYGLAAIVYTQSLTEAHYLAERIEAGNIAINNVDAGTINAPYGGWKNSGLGHEHGPEGLYEYLLTKHVRVRYI